MSDTLPIVEKDILDEEKVPQGSVTLEGAHDMILEVAECAINQPSMVHVDKQLYEVEKADTIVLLMVQDKIVLMPPVDFVITKEFNDVMECKVSSFSVLLTMIPELRQVLHARALFLPRFKTRGQVFSHQGSMMQGAPKSSKLLCSNLKLILSLNLVFNVEGFKGFN